MAGVSLNQAPACVFVLFSIHNVMKAEKLLKEVGIPFDTIPVPKEISSDCGMAILTASTETHRVKQALLKGGIAIKGMYLKTASGYEEQRDG